MDAWGGPKGVRQRVPRRGPTWARRSHLLVLGYALTPCKLRDITEGLHYLHSRDVVHGDLKGVRPYSKSRLATSLMPLSRCQSNILVDATGHAQITDLAFSTVTPDADAVQSPSEGWGQASRWTAPEILNEEGTHSKQADVFSFAMVMVEVHHRLTSIC